LAVSTRADFVEQRAVPVSAAENLAAFEEIALVASAGKLVRGQKMADTLNLK
jgi:hypothetical protein